MDSDTSRTVPHSPMTIASLLSGGDWACADEDPETLSHVAELLGRCLAAPQQMELDAIAKVAASDIGAAIPRWRRFRDHLRTQLGDGTALNSPDE